MTTIILNENVKYKNKIVYVSWHVGDSIMVCVVKVVWFSEEQNEEKRRPKSVKTKTK